jgi:general secretion pathway protein L
MITSTENSSAPLGRLKKQLADSRFLRWWIGELSSMVPAWMRPASLEASSFVAVQLESVDSKMSPPQTVGSSELALTLPSDRVLRKTITLPLATQENLRQVLEFQLDQHTPFSPNQIYFGYRVTARDFEHEQLTVEIVATPREAVDAALKTLGALGSPVRVVFARDMLAANTLVNLLPVAVGTAPSLFRHGANPWLAALVAILALVALAAPIVIKREAVVQMLPWVDKGKKAAETVDSMRRELDARVEQHNYVLEKRQKTPAVIQVLEELTRVLPDDTWVQTLDIKGKELQIQGETASSVRLIGLFEQSSVFKDSSFRSPLTKGQVSGTERYQLALQIRPPALPTVAPAPEASSSAPAMPQTPVSAPQALVAVEKKP